MDKKYYRVYARETVFYESVVEANSEKEAIKIVESGIIEFDDPTDGEDFRVEDAEEINEEEYLFYKRL